MPRRRGEALQKALLAIAGEGGGEHRAHRQFRQHGMVGREPLRSA